MTSTIESSFGSRLMTNGGFLLNNELTDFSFQKEKKEKELLIILNQTRGQDHQWHQQLFSRMTNHYL